MIDEKRARVTVGVFTTILIIFGILNLSGFFEPEEIEVVRIHEPLPLGESSIALNNPSDRFYNFSNNEYPAFKIWWEIENWHANADDIVHIDKIELTLSNTDDSILNLGESILTIKGTEIFDNLLLDTPQSQSIALDEASKIIRTTSDTIYIWNLDTEYLIQGDETYVDWDLEKMVTNPRNHPIILFKMLFDDSNESLIKLIETQVIEAGLEVTIKNYDEDGVFDGWTSFTDRILFVFYQKDKPEHYIEDYYNIRWNQLE